VVVEIFPQAITLDQIYDGSGLAAAVIHHKLNAFHAAPPRVRSLYRAIRNHEVSMIVVPAVIISTFAQDNELAVEMQDLTEYGLKRIMRFCV
jgi:hypothetical protein